MSDESRTPDADEPASETGSDPDAGGDEGRTLGAAESVRGPGDESPARAE